MINILFGKGDFDGYKQKKVIHVLLLPTYVM